MSPNKLPRANGPTNSEHMRTMNSSPSYRTKTLKRPPDSSYTITDSRPAKTNCRVAIGAISVPKNDPRAYREELYRGLFFPCCPTDRTSLREARRRHVLDRVVYGMHGNYNIDKLVLNRETRTPWLVPKVTKEYKRIDYLSDKQEYTAWSRADEGIPVSPTTMPTPEQMSRAEYEDAVAAGDPRVAIDGKHLFEFCRDADLGWLKYEDR